MKKLTVRNFAAIKRIAQNVNPLVVKKNRLLAQAKKLLGEAKEIEEEIKGYEAGVISLTGGYQSEALVTKVVEDTDKVDKDGRPVKTTKYVPTSIVTFNEEDNCYYIPEYGTEAEQPTISVPPTEGMAGSDYDVDAEELTL